MNSKGTAVFGIFSDRRDVEKAAARLQSEGFRSSEISVLFPDKEGTREFAHVSSSSTGKCFR